MAAIVAPAFAAAETSDVRSLHELALGGQARIESVDLADADQARLEGLGLCAGRNVRLVKKGEPCIVSVYGTRIGLTTRLARHIRVSTLG